MQPKYPALYTITNVFRFSGWAALILTAVTVIIGVIDVFLNGQYLGGGLFGFLGELLGAVFGSFIFLALYTLVGGTLAILYFAAAESIQVLLDIEKNTRSK